MSWDTQKHGVEREVTFDIPIITTSLPSNSDSDTSPAHENGIKRSTEPLSDEEADTSFINNNNTPNGMTPILRTLSPGNLNASGVSRGNVRRWSQSLTNASKARQNRAINMMPSRLQKLPTALSLDGQLHRIVDDNAEFEQFVQEIERHDYLLEDSATASQIRIKILRALPQSLHIKRQIKSKVDDIVKEKSQRIGTNRWKRVFHFIGLCTTKSKLVIRSFVRNRQFWSDSMKEIEGHFGAGAQTYFRLFRFLFINNLLLMMITFTLIVFPQMLDDYFQQRAAILKRSNVPKDKTTEDINFLDLLTAEGALENSTLFYGAYSEQRIKLLGSSTYSLPYAYLMTMVCFYAVTFVVFSITTAESYRKSFIATSGGQALRAHKLFCSWDFGISNNRAADMKHHNIYLELTSIVNHLYDNECFLSLWQQIFGYIISAVIWIFVVFVLIVIGGSIVFTTEILEQFDEDNQLSSYFDEYSLFVPSIAVLGLVIFQSLFEFLGYLEIKLVKMYRSARSQLHIALVRNYLLNIVTITALVWFWLTHTDKQTCWETWIAQNIYRLIIVEFVFVTCIGSILRCIRFLIYKFLWARVGISEFSISHGCLGLIFNQTLLWIGIFFSPPLAAVIVLKMIATFYLKKMVLIHFCKAPSKLWRSSQTYTLFLSMIFVSLTIVIVISLFVLTQMDVSETCGPFRNHKYMFHVLRGDILKLQENHFLWQLIMFLVRPAAIGLLLLTLCVLVYYLRSKSKARIEMVKLLKQMLYTEAKDKAFLLANITRVTQNNEWLLEDFMKQTHLFTPRNRKVDKFTDTFARTAGRKFSFLMDEGDRIKLRKPSLVQYLTNGRATFNGRGKVENETLRKRRPSHYE